MRLTGVWLWSSGKDCLSCLKITLVPTTFESSSLSRLTSFCETADLLAPLKTPKLKSDFKVARKWLFFLREKTWEHSGKEESHEYLFFSEFRSFYLKNSKFSLNFWPVRVHKKPSFRFVPITFFANLWPQKITCKSRLGSKATFWVNSRFKKSLFVLLLGSHWGTPKVTF